MSSAASPSYARTVAKELIENGTLGTIRKVVVEYPQGWLATLLEKEGAKQAVWRTDPKQAGVSSCIGDIGSHGENLVSYITGLDMEEMCADTWRWQQWARKNLN